MSLSKYTHNMHPYLSVALALIGGIVAGGIVNMIIVMLGHTLVPLPDGVDMSSSESIRENAYALHPKHYLAPLIAHAAGTYVGSLVGYKLARSYKALVAYCIGFLFLLGGISAVISIPAPLDFILVDLIFAYIPMAYAAVKTLQPTTSIYDDLPK